MENSNLQGGKEGKGGFVSHPLLTADAVDYRDYQVNLASTALKTSTLIVLPTGLGKTIVALMVIAERIRAFAGGKVLFMAPTKPLVEQHAAFLRKFLALADGEIAVMTGEVAPAKRSDAWARARAVVSTPQVVENDLVSGRLSLRDVCLAVFDEAHRAVGDYSYVYVAERYLSDSLHPLVLGMTASPGSDRGRIAEVCGNLGIKSVEIRNGTDRDVRPYVHPTKVEWLRVEMPPEFARINRALGEALAKRVRDLRSEGLLPQSPVGGRITKKDLLNAQGMIQARIRSLSDPPKSLFNAASSQAAAIKIEHAIDLLQTQGVGALNSYFSRLREDARSRGASRAASDMMSDPAIVDAMLYSKYCDVDHPKIPIVADIVSRQLQTNPESRIILFSHYRDMTDTLVRELARIDGCRPTRFVGQASRGGDKGLTQKKQVEMIEGFRRGDYNVLVATSVAEEGLDIPSTNLVIFYEPVPSEIRTIQRRGRTGRADAGRVVVLITKDTKDEAYYWSSRRKEKSMESELKHLQDSPNALLPKPQRPTLTLDEIAKNVDEDGLREERPAQKDGGAGSDDTDANEITIVVDNRELRSGVAKWLARKGVRVVSSQLDVADYVLSSRLGVERKEAGDFLGSLFDGRLFMQARLLRNSYARPLLIIEGDVLSESRNVPPQAVLGAIASISIDLGVSVITTRDDAETAALLYGIAKREQFETGKEVALRGEKGKMSVKERQQFIVEGLPSVSGTLAKRLLEEFGSAKAVFGATVEDLCKVEGIGKKTAEQIIEALSAEYKKL